ncbi:MAG: acyl-CoA thioesterase [Planctomycetes bacterium]|nr:acyl-CoA thioesterase [Planctomycetota bacterium]
MPYELRLRRRVEFADTDLAGVMHFSNYFRFMEVAECAFFRSLGTSIHTEAFGGKLGWPRVHASCDYKAPLRFEDEVEVQLLVSERRERTVAFTYVFRKLDGEHRPEVARGRAIAVCVRFDGPNGGPRATPIPQALADRIDVAPAEALRGDAGASCGAGPDGLIAD